MTGSRPVTTLRGLLRRQPVLVAGPASAADGRELAQAEAERRRGIARAVLVTMRPRQWTKNGLILAAAGAAGALGHDDVPLRVLVTCFAFCLLSGGIYAVNDVRDRHEDRRHPRKRRRPIAAGELSPDFAMTLGVILIALGAAICYDVRPVVGAVAAGYAALTLSYTFLWREVVLLDLIAIAGGFVLRAVAGGVAAPVGLSHWFLLVVSAAAVMVAAGKRLAELRRTQAGAAARRRVLTLYSPRMLMRILVGCALVALFAYAMWASALPAVHGVPWRPLTTVPFAVCLLRYSVLVRAGAGETPEELVLRDRPLALAGAIWLVLFALGVHAAG